MIKKGIPVSKVSLSIIKGLIKAGYDADLIVVDKIPGYPIKPEAFKTKAKFSPYEEYVKTVQIWKVFLGGIEINNENAEPNGDILKHSS